VVRFGKIIEIDFRANCAVIRENTPQGREFLVMTEDFISLVKPFKSELVSFEKDPDYKTTDVAFLIKQHRLERIA
jgi:hypothetical protein